MNKKSCIIVLIFSGLILLIALLSLFSPFGTTSQYKDAPVKAWEACESAEESIEGSFSGSIYVVQKLNNEAPLLNNWSLLSSSSIRSEDPIQFTKILDSASAILCLRFTDDKKRTCTFQPEQEIDFYGMKMDATLISWPDGELLASTVGISLPPATCPYVLQCEDDCQPQREEVLFPRPWLLQYIE